ncbi:MAG: aspartate kinase [bacterium]
MKKVIVLKFGGSSVASVRKIKNAARRIITFKNRGFKPVVVVSAAGNSTDDLTKEALKLSKNPHAREMDMLLSTGEQKTISLLAIALSAMKQKVISFTGHQIGIITDGNFSNARIKTISAKRLTGALKNNFTVIVAGFQGQTAGGEITTLGRGGSDLTAIALAAVLKAGCKIFTDVEGIFTANPEIYKNAKKIDIISYDEMLEMAGAGAGVMQARAVELAKNRNVAFEVASSFATARGTLICGEEQLLEKLVVRSITEDKNQTKVSIVGVPDRPGIAAEIFKQIAEKDICVDMIIQSAAQPLFRGHRPVNDISFTVKKKDTVRVKKILEKIGEKLCAKRILIKENVAKISIIGSGMKTHSGVAARMFGALAKNKINIEMIATSEIKISCVIECPAIRKAVKALVKEFKL